MATHDSETHSCLYCYSYRQHYYFFFYNQNIIITVVNLTAIIREIKKSNSPCLGLSIGNGSPIFQKKYRNINHTAPVSTTYMSLRFGTEKQTIASITFYIINITQKKKTFTNCKKQTEFFQQMLRTYYAALTSCLNCHGISSSNPAAIV